MKTTTAIMTLGLAAAPALAIGGPSSGRAFPGFDCYDSQLAGTATLSASDPQRTVYDAQDDVIYRIAPNEFLKILTPDGVADVSQEYVPISPWPFTKDASGGAGYCPLRDEMLAMGGVDYGLFHDGVWTVHAKPAAMETLGGEALAYDSSRGVFVLFGGVAFADGAWRLTDQTWEYDGAAWTLVETTAAPPPTHSAAMAYDESRGVMVLFGGRRDTTHFGGDVRLTDEMWEYDGQTWSRVTPSSGERWPGPRSHAGMTWDPIAGQLLMYGGAIDAAGTPTADLFAYADGVWSPLVAPQLERGEGFEVFFHEGLHRPYIVSPAPAVLEYGNVPTIFEQPQSRSVKPGESAHLLVTTPWALGPSPYAFQWFKDGEPIRGATDPVLFFDRVRAHDAGVYTCEVRVATDPARRCAVVTEPATIDVADGACAADTTGDGVVDALDLNELLLRFNTPCD